jgi:hypothetical protein
MLRQLTLDASQAAEDNLSLFDVDRSVLSHAVVSEPVSLAWSYLSLASPTDTSVDERSGAERVLKPRCRSATFLSSKSPSCSSSMRLSFAHSGSLSSTGVAFFVSPAKQALPLWFKLSNA